MFVHLSTATVPPLRSVAVRWWMYNTKIRCEPTHFCDISFLSLFSNVDVILPSKSELTSFVAVLSLISKAIKSLSKVHLVLFCSVVAPLMEKFGLEDEDFVPCLSLLLSYVDVNYSRKTDLTRFDVILPLILRNDMVKGPPLRCAMNVLGACQSSIYASSFYRSVVCTWRCGRRSLVENYLTCFDVGFICI